MRIALLAAAAVVVLAATGAEAKRALAPEASYADFAPAVSPDGMRVAFVRQGVTPAHLVRSPSIYTVGLDGHSVVALTKGSAQSSSNGMLGHYDGAGTQSWSPDGQRLVYAHEYQGTRYDYPRTELVIVDSDGRNAHQLTTTEPPTFLKAYSPSWSWARDAIAFSDGADIWVINPDGSGLIQLTHDSIPDFSPSWSPDGSRIAFIRGPDSDVTVMNVDGTDLRMIASHAGASAPAWSPDGKTIALSANLGPGRDIYAVDSDGGNLRQLTNNRGDESDPTWTPDGKSVLFSSDRGRSTASPELWIMDADGSNQHVLIPHMERASNRRRCTITGTAVADRLQGTASGDVLCGFDGNDTIQGFGGSDVFDGGKGKDVLDAGAGNDLILARDHRKDTVKGGPGFDRARVDRGVDKVSGVEKLLP